MTDTVPRRTIATALSWSTPIVALLAAAPAAAASPSEQPDSAGYTVDDSAHVLIVVNPTSTRLRARLVVTHVRFPEPTLPAPYLIAGATGQPGSAFGRDIVFYDLGVVVVPDGGSWVSSIALVRGPGEASYTPSTYSFRHKLLLTTDRPYGSGGLVLQRGPIVSTAYLPSATSQPAVDDLPG